MKLQVGRCSECGACEEACPGARILMKCTQCNECVKICPQNAFYLVSPTVYAIDPSKCNGCGLCKKACPQNAIVIENGKARKCDLCLKCVEVCPKGLKLVNTLEEQKEIEKELGWEKCYGEYKVKLYSPSYDEFMFYRQAAEEFKDAVKNRKVGVLDIVEECDSWSLDKGQKKHLVEMLEKELTGYSFLTPILQDNSLEEIAVNGTESVRVFHRKKGWQKVNARFTSSRRVREIINKMARGIGRRVTLKSPRLNACLPDGSRLHAAIPPIVKEPTITIRKFTKKPFTAKDLVRMETVGKEVMAFLSACMQCNFNVVIAGGTGSGKTTLLNVLTHFIPLNERLIIVEETPEIRVKHEHCVRLVVNQALGIGMRDLVTDTLRMRPDRVIVGEVRAEKELKAFVNTMLAGQGKGSMTTFHANSAQECLQRMKALGIQEQELNSIDLIIVQKRWNAYNSKTHESREVRRITEVAEVVGCKVRPLFVLETKPLARKSQVHEKIQRAFGKNSAEMRREFIKRRGWF